MASQRDVNNALDDEVVVKLAKYDYAAEIGGGFDMFLPYFKFGIELKGSIGAYEPPDRRRHALQRPDSRACGSGAVHPHLHLRRLTMKPTTAGGRTVDIALSPIEANDPVLVRQAAEEAAGLFAGTAIASASSNVPSMRAARHH